MPRAAFLSFTTCVLLAGLTHGNEDARATLTGHTGVVHCVAFSAKGALLASASEDQTVRLHDVRTGDLRHTLAGHTDGVHGLSFSPDGQVLASASWDNTVRLWQTATGKHTGTLTLASRIHAIAFTPDGKFLATGCGEPGYGYLHVWQMDRGGKRAVFLFRKRTGELRSLAFSADGKRLVAGSHDGVLRVWDVKFPAVLPAQPTHERKPSASPITSVAFSPDGKTLASGSADKASVKLHEAATLKELAAFESNPVFSLAFRDDRTLASGGLDGALRFYRVQERRPLSMQFPHPGKQICGVAFSPEGKTLATAGADHTVKLFDVESTTLVHEFSNTPGDVHVVAMSPKGGLLASGCGNRVLLWDVKTGKGRGSLKLPGAAYDLAFHPDGRTLAVLPRSRSLILWDTATGKDKPVPTPSSGESYRLRFSPDGKFLALTTGHPDRGLAKINIWRYQADAQSLQQVLALEDDASPFIAAFAFHPTGRKFATGDFKGRIKIWEFNPPAKPGKPLVVPCAEKDVAALHFSASGDKLFSVSLDECVNCFDAQTWKREKVIAVNHPGSWGDYSPDAGLLAVGTEFSIAHLCDVKRGAKAALLIGHSGHTSGQAFSPDGKLLATADSAGKVKLWNLDVLKQRKGPVIWIGEPGK